MLEQNEHLKLVAEAYAARVTDLHVDPAADGYAIRFRIDGALHDQRRLDRKDGERLINQFKVESGIDPGAMFTPRSSRRTLTLADHELDYRLTLAPCISGPKLAIRLLDPDRVRHDVNQLGIDEEGLEHVREWLGDLNGMFLVSGPTASGKTTTLYALLHELAERQRHIMTIEEPVEYEIERINQMQVDHTHGLDFAEGIRTILRLDPDYLMVGEMREAESAKAAIGAAVNGHILLSTIHARDAVSAVTALRNFGLTDHQIAVALSVVVNQRLVRVLCPKCRKEAPLSDDDRAWFGLHSLEAPTHDWKAEGCPACEQIGYRGRTGLFEIWRMREAEYEMLLCGADEGSLRKHLEGRSHKTLGEQGVARIEAGVTDVAELRHAGLSLPWEE